jgi:uncharacterized protein
MGRKRGHNSHPRLASRSRVSYTHQMTQDEIIAALQTENAAAALTAGVAHANELAPQIYAMADKFCAGIHLLPRDNKLLFNGLHVLAAAKHPGLCDYLLGIARQDPSQLDQLFPDHVTISLARLLLSVWDREPVHLFELIEHADMAPEASWAFYEVLARLTFDGHMPRDEATAFLVRIEQDNLFDDGDLNWWGWELAVAKLGLVELEPALRRVWSKPIYEQHSEADHAEMLDTLRLAATNPTDARPFDEAHMRAINDPVEAVAWVERRAAMTDTWGAEHADGSVADTDAAKAVRLTDDEEDWLAGFLASPQVPDSTTSLEMLDGLFTALVIGPRLVLPSRYMSAIWGEHEGDKAEPDWDSSEQAEYVFSLLTKHWNAIAARRQANAEHRPIIDNFSMAMTGEEWALGFMTGVDMQEDAWDPLFDDPHADQLLLPILALCGDIPDEMQEQLTDEMCEAILDQLPAALQMIAAYWHAPNQSFPRHNPVRSTKVGRNEPCPCGSGKKFKKCCGSETPPMVH